MDDNPSKLEYEIAKYLKNTLPVKRTTLLGNKVDYFIGMYLLRDDGNQLFISVFLFPFHSYSV